MMRRDFFISCSHEDITVAQWVANVLESNGYTTYLYARDIRPGENFMTAIEDMLSSSRGFIVIYSDNYRKSHFCQTEFHAAFTMFHQGNMEAVLPIRIENVPMEPLYAALVHIDLFETDDSSASVILRAIGHSMVSRSAILEEVAEKEDSATSAAEILQETESLNECKVIFLGDGAAGKSSLIERIVNNRFEPNSLPTDGVKMTFWKTEIEGKVFTLRVLDFGGQEIMHSSHRCFLTGHTVYVIVCDGREDAGADKLDGAAVRWVETIKSFAPECPVILALNKADLNENVSVNEKQLKSRNPMLKEVIKTSAAVDKNSKYSVTALIQAIHAEVPACINYFPLNRDMLAVKRELEDMEENYITAGEYQTLCETHNIEDSKLQDAMLGYFRDLGVAYFYKSKKLNPGPESVRVLNPEWLTNGIYRLILRTPEGGFLSHDEIRKVLASAYAGDQSGKIYTAEETAFILYVMEMFEISLEIKEGEEMIPLKMRKTPPDSIDDFPKDDALHLRWKGVYLPNNLIHRLMIRKASELDLLCVWRTGGRFRNADKSCTALVEMSDEALDVYVTGKGCLREYMAGFRDEIHRLQELLNLQMQEMICCKVDGEEDEVPYSTVMDAYSQGVQTIFLYNIKKNVSPASLLRETYPNWKKEAEEYQKSNAVNPENVKAITEIILNIIKILGIVGFIFLILFGIINLADPEIVKTILGAIFG